MGKDDQLTYAYSILERAVSLHKPKYAVAFFSGGYDSLVTTHLTMSYMERYYPKLPRFVAHINTGIGIEETRTLVRETCARYGWTLKEYTTADNYDDLAMEYGFPGPAMHGVMYIKLKERPVAQMIREQKKFDRLLLFTGARKQGSERRMGYVVPSEPGEKGNENYRQLFFRENKLVGVLMIGSPKGRKTLVEVVKSQQLIETAAEREALFTLKERKRHTYEIT